MSFSLPPSIIALLSVAPTSSLPFLFCFLCSLLLYVFALSHFVLNGRMASAMGREVICTDQHDSFPPQMISQIHLQLFVDT